MNEAVGTGRQIERTVLAHWRTEMAMVVVAMLVVRQAAPGVERAMVAPVALLAVAVQATVGFRRQRHLVAGSTTASPRTLSGVAIAVVVLQLAALVVVI